MDLTVSQVNLIIALFVGVLIVLAVAVAAYQGGKNKGIEQGAIAANARLQELFTQHEQQLKIVAELVPQTVFDKIYTLLDLIGPAGKVIGAPTLGTFASTLSNDLRRIDSDPLNDPAPGPLPASTPGDAGPLGPDGPSGAPRAPGPTSRS